MAALSDQVNMEQPRSPDSQVITYTAPWIIYSLAFSANPAYPYRLAIGSFLEQVSNQVEIVQLNFQESSQSFQKKSEFEHQFPCTKMLWIPDKTGTCSDLLATSGQYLRIYEVIDNKQTKLKSELICVFLLLKQQNQFAAPLTSFDWNPVMTNTIVTASIDTTCAIWDVEKSVTLYQLIAHDKEAYDVHFSKDKDIFASVGADGSVRQFDLRELEHSTVMYETSGNPLIKLAWNRNDSNYLAVLEMDQPNITLLDNRYNTRQNRKPGKAMGFLRNHKNSANALAWAPQSSYHLCSVGDDKQAFIWDLKGYKDSQYFPLLEYKAEDQISNVTWSISQPQWISICYKDALQILQFC